MQGSEIKISGIGVQETRETRPPSRQIAMNAEPVATIAEDHKVGDSQDTGVAYATTTEVPLVRQRCKAGAEAFEQDL